MLLKVTNKGIENATKRARDGHYVSLRSFKLGSVSQLYEPVVGQEVMQGVILYEAPVTYFEVVSSDTIEVLLLLPETARSTTTGNSSFTFNEVGIFDEDGDLFGIGLLTSGDYLHVQGETRLKIKVQLRLTQDQNAVFQFIKNTTLDSRQWAEDWTVVTPVGDGRSVIVPGVDVTAVLHNGRKVRTTTSAKGPIVAVVSSASFNGTDTTVVLGRDDIDAGTTVLDYGILSADESTALPVQPIQLFSKVIDNDVNIPIDTTGISINEVEILPGATVTVMANGRWKGINV